MSWNCYSPVERLVTSKHVIICTFALVLKMFFHLNAVMIVTVKQNARDAKKYLCRWLEKNNNSMVRKVFRRKKNSSSQVMRNPTICLKTYTQS